MDSIDKKILDELQKNSSQPLSELSKKVGLSNTPCWNRIKKLEEDKIIKSRSISLENKKINLPITVLLSISIQNHKEHGLKNYEKVINKSNGNVIIKVNPKYFRPAEVNILIGSPEKAKKDLSWEPEVKFEELVKMMVEYDTKLIKPI